MPMFWWISGNSHRSGTGLLGQGKVAPQSWASGEGRIYRKSMVVRLEWGQQRWRICVPAPLPRVWAQKNRQLGGEGCRENGILGRDQFGVSKVCSKQSWCGREVFLKAWPWVTADCVRSQRLNCENLIPLSVLLLSLPLIKEKVLISVAIL